MGTTTELYSDSDAFRWALNVAEGEAGGGPQHACAQRGPPRLVRIPRVQRQHTLAGLFAGLEYLHAARPTVIHRDLKVRPGMPKEGGGTCRLLIMTPRPWPLLCRSWKTSCLARRTRTRLWRRSQVPAHGLAVGGS
jgi:hypothetical protein